MQGTVITPDKHIDILANAALGKVRGDDWSAVASSTTQSRSAVVRRVASRLRR